LYGLCGFTSRSTVWRLGVRIAGTPGAVAELNIADLVEPEAAPLACAGETRAALSGELIGECFLLTVGVAAEDDRAKLARVSVVQAQDLFLRAHGLTEQVVDAAWHGIPS
jgi:hypothetical protein